MGEQQPLQQDHLGIGQNCDQEKITRKVIVIGAGISGLTAAHALITSAQREGKPLQVTIIESTDRAGGVIKTTTCGLSKLECGPEAFLTSKPDVLNLCKELGILDRVISTASTNRQTFVAFDKELHPLPDGFMMFAPTKIGPLIKSRLFSASGKMRMALDLVLPRSECQDDESLAAFVIRRLGHEALERIAEPLICGIYGSNPNQLSARSTAAALVKMEETDGSLIRGLWRQMRLSQHGQPPSTKTTQAGLRYSQMASLDDGMSVLIDSLLSKLPPGALVTNKSVERIRHGINGRRWDIVLTDGSVLTADGLILAVPAKHAAKLLREVSGTLADKLNSITYTSATIVNLLYKRNQIEHAMNGFGFVVPMVQRRIVRACTFSSIKFANRAAEDEVLVRVSTEQSQAANSEIEQMISDELGTYLNVRADPLFSLISRHATAIPQYAVGHNDLVNEIEWAVAKIPGLALSGNAYGGVGIPDCIKRGKEAAQTLMSTVCA